MSITRTPEQSAREIVEIFMAHPSPLDGMLEPKGFARMLDRSVDIIEGMNYAIDHVWITELPGPVGAWKKRAWT